MNETTFNVLNRKMDEPFQPVYIRFNMPTNKITKEKEEELIEVFLDIYEILTEFFETEILVKSSNEGFEITDKILEYKKEIEKLTKEEEDENESDS